ncbi:MAG: hypothetical protein GY928_00840 [Colwellia sp.]|nr:hypothetical protein [Colwellia sp.]
MKKNETSIPNLGALWERLSDTFDGLESGEVEYKVAAELNNTAGKMINLAKTQLEYFALRKETPDIKFLTQD